MALSDELRSDLVKGLLPVLVDLDDQLRRGRWLVRFAQPLTRSADMLERELESWAASELSRLYVGDYDVVQVERAYPRIRAYQIDELRYLLEIEFAGVGREVGHSFLVSMHGVLNELHRRHGLDEIQGLPPCFWYFLDPAFHVGPPE
jgi:hypothetical protein